jgi:16S rRNA (cytosine1402-N4)-methyltransferase
MMTDRDGGNAVDGGLVRHIPVLAAEVLHFLDPRDDGIYVDGTFGAGGCPRDP